MDEYKLQGLTCGNCAREMEEEINKLENGEGSRILYNSSKLILNKGVDMQKVEKILSSDGAALVKDHGDEHAHDHSHEHTNSRHNEDPAWDFSHHLFFSDLCGFAVG